MSTEVETDVDRLEAGPELDALIGEALDFEPRVTWEVLNPQGTGSAIGFDREYEAHEWLKKHLQDHPGSVLKDFHVGPWKHWPRFSTKMADAWQVVEKLQSLGFDVVVEREGLSVTSVEVWKDDECLVVEGTSTLPASPAHAICRAAYKLLTEGK